MMIFTPVAEPPGTHSTRAGVVRAVNINGKIPIVCAVLSFRRTKRGMRKAAIKIMQYAWYDIVGSVGVLTIISTYVLLQTERVKSESLTYSVLNGAGAALIAFSLFYSFNFSAFVVELLWMLISIYGIARYFWKKD